MRDVRFVMKLKEQLYKLAWFNTVNTVTVNPFVFQYCRLNAATTWTLARTTRQMLQAVKNLNLKVNVKRLNFEFYN